MADGEVRVNVTANTDQFESRLRSSEKQAKNFERTVTATANSGVDQLNRKLVDTAQRTEAFGRAADDSGKKLKSFRGNVTQLGFQIQDIAVQAQSGTNAFVILGQQGSQILSLLGPMGSIAGAALAIGAAVAGPLLTAFGDAQKASEEVNKEFEKLVDNYDELTQAQKRYVESISTDQIKNLNLEIRALENEQSSLSKTLQSPIQFPEKQLKRYEDRLVAIGSQIDSKKEKLKELQDSTDESSDSIERLIENLEFEAATIGKTAREVDLYKAALAKATPEQIKQINALYDLIEAREKAEKKTRKLVEGLRDEIATLEIVSERYLSGAIGMNDLAREREKISSIMAAGHSINSQEGQDLAALIDARNDLVDTIQDETQSRQLEIASRARIASIEDQIHATEMMTSAIGGSRDEMNAASAASAAYKLEQDLISQAITRNGEITEAQRAKIAEQVKSYEQVILKLQQTKDAQNDLNFSQQMLFESQQRLQSISIDTNSVEMMTQAIGGNKEELLQATVAIERYRLEQELLNQAMRQGIPLTDELKKQISDQADAYGQSIEQLERARMAQSEAIEEQRKLQQGVENFQQTMAQGFTDLIFGADSFSDSLKRMVLEISRAIVQAQILNAIQSSTGGGTGGAGGAGSFFTAIASAFQYHDGGTVGSGTRRNVPVSNFIGAPRFHNGLKHDEFPAILQKGEEVIPKDRVGRRQVSGATTQVFNITTPDPDGFRKSKRQMAREVRMKTLS